MRNITVVTGGTGGMGFAISNIFGKQGPVLLCDINEETLKSSVAVLERQNMEAHYVVADVSKPEQVKAALEKGKSLGKIKNLIHTSGVSPAQVTNLDDKIAAKTIMEVNAMGTVNMIETFCPALEEGATMVCFSSSAAYIMAPFPENAVTAYNTVLTDRAALLDNLMSLTGRGPGSAYMFSKMFVRHYVQMNAMRFGNKGCRIVSIAPGRIITPQHKALIDKEPERIEGELASTPLHRYGAAYEIGNLVEYLCGSGASFINGIDVLMDGGYQAASSVPQLD